MEIKIQNSLFPNPSNIPNVGDLLKIGSNKKISATVIRVDEIQTTLETDATPSQIEKAIGVPNIAW